MSVIHLQGYGVSLTYADARRLADTVFALADFCRRRGQRVNPGIMKLAGEIVSICGNPEPPPQADEETVVHEQIDVNGAAKILGCSTRNVRTLAGKQRLPGWKQQGKWWFNRDDVETFRDYRH